MSTPEENKENIEEIQQELREIKRQQKLRQVISFDWFKDMSVDYARKIYKAHIGLPVFSAVPTYTGFEGEHIWVNDGTNYIHYAYINSGWRNLGNDGLDYSFKFGDGSDGDKTFVGNDTLTEDKFYSNLTINNGITLDSDGYRIFVSGIFTNKGTLARNGNNGATGVAGVTAGGVALNTNTIGGSSKGGDGGQGVGSSGDDANPGNGGDGGDGGGGGWGANNFVGGSGGNVTNPTTNIKKYPFSVFLSDFPTSTLLLGGAGGGGGGGDGIGGEKKGGGGGSGGGVILITAKTIINTGTISTIGGNGGDGGINLPIPIPEHRTGGGGGGGGGLIMMLYKSLTNSGTISVAGGTGGDGKNGGINGDDGSTGALIQLKE